MEPIWGFILFLIFCGIVSLIAHKKGRSGTIFFLASSLPALPLVMLVAKGTQGNGTVAGVSAFLCPLVGFVTAIMVDNGERKATKTGEFGDYRKCPFCAESVRKEAVKCKHCGSALQVPTPSPTAPTDISGGAGHDYSQI
jgi:hypothetical protein